MKGLVRWWGCIGSVLVLVLASHCGDSTEPPTQITARIYVDQALRRDLTALRVASASRASERGAWQTGDAQTFGVGQLRRPLSEAPVDFTFVPRGGDADKQLEIVVDALAAGDQRLAQVRALVRFVAKKQRLLELWLAPCGSTGVCETDPDCHGQDCQACTSGQCARVRSYAEGDTVPLDESVVPDPNKAPPSGSGVTPGTITCATPGTTIVCNDDNDCNGRETCDPGRADSAANGCATVVPAIVCGAGNTCSATTGCTSCSERPDGDADGSASDGCPGGNDCNDNDVAIAPGKPELCDDKDNDCNGVVDDAAPANDDCEDKNGAGSTCVMGACSQPRTPVTVRFRGTVGTAAFACSAPVPLGMPPRDVSPRDFRFFVQEVSLVNAEGALVPVTLDERLPFQTRQVGLIDFSGAGCAGDPETNTTITGTVPAGEYREVEFVVGVPAMPTGATSPPLNAEGATRMGGGFRFLMATVRSGASAPPADAGAPDGGAGDGGAPADAGAGTGERTTAISLTERTRVRIPSFNPGTDSVRANFAPIFADLDLGESLTCEAAAMCAPSYAALGLPGPQRVFTKD